MLYQILTSTLLVLIAEFVGFDVTQWQSDQPSARAVASVAIAPLANSVPLPKMTLVTSNEDPIVPPSHPSVMATGNEDPIVPPPSPSSQTAAIVPPPCPAANDDPIVPTNNHPPRH